MQASVTSNFSGGVNAIPPSTISTNYTKTIVKKLYPDGRYFLETTTPYYNTVTDDIEYATTKEFITELDLTVCGCIEDSEANKEKIKSCCSSVYDSYYSEYYGECNNDMGGYKIFPEIGILQLDKRYRYDQLYLEYVGCMPKLNGEYAIPEVAFETLVAYVKFKSVENKENETLSTKQWYFSNYMRERNNMEKIMSRVSLSSIIDIMNQAPKFEIDMGDLRYYNTNTGYTGVTKINKKVSESVCEANQAACNTPVFGKHLTPFQLAVIAGNGSGTPVADEFTYTNQGLIGAVNINEISVNKNLETTIAGDFTFNSGTGTITRINPWFAGDTLIIGFAKLV